MTAQLVSQFDLWRPSYGGAVVTVYKAGTSTKATLYANEAKTSTLSNPQTLTSKAENGVNYGRFAQPVYVDEAYWLEVDNAENTGIERQALTTLNGQDASSSLVTATGGSEANTLANIVGRFVHVGDFGTLTSSSASTNTTILAAAIGAVASRGGGWVLLPEGTIPFTTLQLPEGVKLRGHGRGVTILQSEEGGTDIIRFDGDRCGLIGLTLDGVAKSGQSVGVRIYGRDESRFADCEIKRFATGVYAKGARRTTAHEFYVDDCDAGLRLRGDTNSSGSTAGDVFRGLNYFVGKISNCTDFGVRMENVDTDVISNLFHGVVFDTNVDAIRLRASRHLEFHNCLWENQTGKNIDIDNDDDDEIGSISVTVVGGYMSGGEVQVSGLSQDIIFDRVQLDGVTFDMDTPLYPVLLRDCVEDGNTVISGDGTMLVRSFSTNKGATTGVTTDNAATKAWGLILSPGEIVGIRATCIGNQRNGAQRSLYVIEAGAYRPGSTLDYDAQSTNFNAGETITGAESGATAVIQADSDSGTSGTLTLRSIVGDFIDNEIISGSQGGSATTNGTVVDQDVTISGITANAHISYETDANWNAEVQANGSEIEVQVTGNTGQTVDWVCEVEIIRNG